MTRIFFLLILVSNSFFAFGESEAMRYARHGCEVKNNQTACAAMKRLLKYKKNPSKSKPIVFKDTIDLTSEPGNSSKLDLTIEMDSEAAASMMGNCDEFGQKLKNCDLFKCSYKHPFGGQAMNRTIVGKIGNLCVTEETMPNNGLMKCAFKEDQLPLAASFYKNTQGENKDFLTKANRDGTCIISGY